MKRSLREQNDFPVSTGYFDTNLKIYLNFLKFLDVFLDLVFKKLYFSDSYLKADSLGFKSWFYHLLALKP